MKSFMGRTDPASLTPTCEFRAFARDVLTGLTQWSGDWLQKLGVSASDPLDSWARRNVFGLTANLNAVAFGNGVFVAVGDNSTVATSTDVASWNVGSPGAYGNLAVVRFLNGEFIAVGSTDKILTSTDGTSWSAGALPGVSRA